MPAVLTGTLRAVARDVGSGSCRCLRLYRVNMRQPGTTPYGLMKRRVMRSLSPIAWYFASSALSC